MYKQKTVLVRKKAGSESDIIKSWNHLQTFNNLGFPENVLSLTPKDL